MDVEVRAGADADLPALTEIYNYYVRTSAVTFDVEPFTAEQRVEWMAGFRPTGPHRLLVATGTGAVLGYASSTRLRPKPAYDTSVETTVYCHPDAVGNGVGTRLYAALFATLAPLDLHRAYAGVALPNDASLALHRRFGFHDVGVMREVGRKFGRYWDVLWLERPLGSGHVSSGRVT